MDKRARAATIRVCGRCGCLKNETWGDKVQFRRRKLGALLVVALLATVGVMVLGGAPAGAGLAPLHLFMTAHPTIHCDWGVTKSASFHGAPVTNLTLAVDEQQTVDYTVNVTKSCSNRVAGVVTGLIGGIPTSLTVTLAGGVNATVSNCTTVNTGFSCDYAGVVGDTADGSAVAVGTYSDGSSASGQIPYSFAGVQPDEPSVGVFDSYAGALAYHLDHSASFQYSRVIAFHDCGRHVVENTVTVQDSVPLASATHSIVVDVPCVGGCTLTQGYWKTHSKYGPAAKPDPAWNLLPGGLGPDTPFFGSGQTWIQVFNTSPSGGNVYYVLAHQYEAAVLNQLDGASSTSAVNAALAGAKSFFDTYTPAQAGALAKNSSVRAQTNAWATTLDNYNSGLVGPGHCDE